MSANKVSPTVISLIAQPLILILNGRVPGLESDPQKKISLSLNYASSFMIWEIRTAITAVWMMKSSPWRIGIECCATTRPVVSTKIVRDSTEPLMRFLTPVDSLKTLSSCSPISKQYNLWGVFFCYAIQRISPFFFVHSSTDHSVLRTKQNLDLNDEVARCKRMLDEKYFEAGRLRDEAVTKGDQNQD